MCQRVIVMNRGSGSEAKARASLLAVGEQEMHSCRVRRCHRVRVCVLATAAPLSRARSLWSAHVTHTGRRRATWALDVPNDAGKITCRWVKCRSALTALLMQNLQVCCTLKAIFISGHYGHCCEFSWTMLSEQVS